MWAGKSNEVMEEELLEESFLEKFENLFIHKMVNRNKER